MKIVCEPPKTGEEFLVCYVDSDSKVVSNVMFWCEEWGVFDSVNDAGTVVTDEDSFFKGTTILVSKGE